MVSFIAYPPGVVDHIEFLISFRVISIVNFIYYSCRSWTSLIIHESWWLIMLTQHLINYSWRHKKNWLWYYLGQHLYPLVNHFYNGQTYHCLSLLLSIQIKLQGEVQTRNVSDKNVDDSKSLKWKNAKARDIHVISQWHEKLKKIK